MTTWYTARVATGDGRGKALGFPTVNCDISPAKLDVDYGIYSAKVKIDGQTHLGAFHFGPRPVFGDPKPVIEIHILDFEGEIPGKILRFSLEHYLRPIRYFPTKEELIDQIRQDVQRIRQADSSKFKKGANGDAVNKKNKKVESLSNNQ